ncbi:unnamed protein product [Polarella glacialis]|uniref:ABC transporter domain-containing protein n=1 Tax=Polarella glacialis TaxID=89957 RepID=A0A813FWY3_POLGL|nr:unnamed protein product [Polarella glacialis]
MGVALALVARRVCAGQATFGDVLMVQGLVQQLWAPMQFLGFYIRQARQALVDLEDAQRLLSREVSPLELAEAGDDEPEPMGSDRSSEARQGHDRATGSFLLLPPASAQIPVLEFRSVSFRHQDSAPWVLQDVSFSVEAGSRVALVGSSGSGKSSLGRLVPRLFDPTAGSVLFNGMDLRQLRLSELRRRLAVVSQDAAVFNTSLRQNIAYGRPKSSREELERAVRASGLQRSFEKLDLSLDTVVGERGLRLSGGERQRLALSRALLRIPEAELLILDEATSALDASSEKQFLDALDVLLRRQAAQNQKAAAPTATTIPPPVGGTVPALLAITHRLALAKQADEILVLEGGRLVQRGSHAELAAKQGCYARLLDAACQAEQS